MISILNILIVLMFWSNHSFSQNIIQGQNSLKGIMKNATHASLRNALKVELTYNDVNSKIAKEHTKELRAAQMGMNQLFFALMTEFLYKMLMVQAEDILLLKVQNTFISLIQVGLWMESGSLLPHRELILELWI